MNGMSRVLAFFCTLVATSAQVLPGFSTYRGDPQNSNVLQEDGPIVGNKIWDFNTNITTGAMIDNSAVIGSNGDLFFSLSDVFFCVSKDGEQKWRHKAAGIFFQSTASITEDAVYIIGSDFHWGDEGFHSYLMAFSTAGKLLWSYKLKYGRVYGSVNVLEDGTIVFVVDEFHLHAFSPAGELLWDFDELGEYNENASVLENTPAVHPDGSIVFVAKDGKIRSLSDGKLQWDLQITPFYKLNSPIIGEDGNIYVSVDEGYGYTYNASVYCISSTGAVVWKYVASAEFAVSVLTAPSYHNGNVYLVMDHYLYSLREGELMWRYYFHDPAFGSLTAWNTPVIAKNDMLYIGAFFWVYAFDIAGTELSHAAPGFTWRYQTTTYGANTLGTGPIPTVDSDGHLYVGAYNKLYAIGAK